MCGSRTENWIMKRILYLLSLAVLVLAGCAQEVDLSEINNRLDKLENVKIASVQEQINSIKNSLPAIENTSKELKGYITSLQSAASSLEQQIKNANDRVDALEVALNDSISTAKADLLAQLVSVKEDMKAQLAVVEAAVYDLKCRDEELVGMIAELREYVNSGSVNSSIQEWANATFATLEKFNALTDELSVVKAQITSLSESVNGMEGRLSSKISADIAAASAILDAKLMDQYADITASYTSAIQSLKQTVVSEYSAAIAEAVSDVEESIKGWVNSQLSGYSTIAQTDAKLAVLRNELEGRLLSQKSYLESLVNSLVDEMDERIAENSALIEQLQGSIAGSSQIDAEQAAKIAANSQNIIENTNRIFANVAAISNNSIQIDALRSAIEKQQDEMDEQIAELTAKLNASGANVQVVQQKIEELRTDYMSAISNLRASVNERIAANEALVGANKKAVDENTQAVAANTAAVEQMRVLFQSEITRIAQKVDDNVRSIATNAAFISQNAYAITTNTNAIAKNSEDILQLQQSISNIKGEIVSMYMSAISSAINNHDGTIRDVIAQNVTSLHSRISTEIGDVNVSIAALSARVESVEGEVSQIKNTLAYILQEIASGKNQIEGINQNIASLQAQLASIRQSIGSVEQMEGELQSYISDVQKVKADLEEALVDFDAKIAQAKVLMESQISTAKADLLAQLSAVRGQMVSQINELSANINVLTAKDSELKDMIEDLEAYTNQQIQDTKGWAMGTFVTLDKYNALSGEITSIKASIAVLTNNVNALDNELSEKISTEIAAAVAEMDSNVKSKVNDAIGICISAVNTAKADITNAYTQAIANAIMASENSMRSWVNEQLTGYYTISEVDAKLAALESSYASQLSAQRTYLENLVSSLSTELKGMIGSNTVLINSMNQELQSIKQSQGSQAAGQIAANAQSISELSQKVLLNSGLISANAGKISNLETEIAACKAQASGQVAQLRNEMNELVEQNTQLIEANQAAIQANTTAVSQNSVAIATLRGSVDASLVKKAEDIATNAAGIARNASLISTNTTAISNNASAIAKNSEDILRLQGELYTTKTQLTASYKQAIDEAIASSEGNIRGLVASQIASANATVESKIDAANALIQQLSGRIGNVEIEVNSIKQQMSAILAEIAQLKSKLAELMGRIQSVSYIPKYADGKACVIDGIAELDFKVAPKSAVTDIVANWQSVLSVNAVYTITRAVTFVDMPVLSVEGDGANGVITVKVSATGMSEAFYNGTQSASVALTLTDGNNEINSDYFQLTPYHPYNEIWYTSSDENIVVPDSADGFGAKIVSNSYANGKGVIKFDGPVTSVPEMAFGECGTVTSVTLPESVVTIGDGAFSYCSNLAAFYGKFASEDNKMLVDNGVMLAFAPAGVTEYTIPYNVSAIGFGSFAGSPVLKKVTIGSNVKSVGDLAFGDCSSLETVTLAYGVTSIGEWAFIGCSQLGKVSIPSSVTSIGREAFCECTGELSINCNIPAAASPVSQSNMPFGSSKFTKVIFGLDVTHIGAAAFYQNRYLKDVQFGSNVAVIEAAAFRECAALTSVTLPESVNLMYYGVFIDCRNLESVYSKAAVPPAVNKGDGEKWAAFDGNAPDRKIYVPAASANLYREADGWKEYADAIVGYDFEKGEIVEAQPADEFWYTSIDGSVVSPKTTSDFDANIVSNTYQNGKGVIKFDGPVTTIKREAFYENNKLTSVSISDNVTTIESGAFYQCDNLVEVEIGKSITTIGIQVFRYCSKLTKIYCKALVPPAIYYQYDRIGSFPFNENGMKIYVPRESFDLYNQYTGWLDMGIDVNNWSQYKFYLEAYDF